MTFQVSVQHSKKKKNIYNKCTWHNEHLKMVESDAPEFAGKVKCANVQMSQLLPG